jgi:hypothetical protein
MNDFSQLGKVIMFIGLVLAVVGLLLFLAGGKIPWVGRLPGDVYIKGKNWSFFFPLGTSILISMILSVILWFISHR